MSVPNLSIAEKDSVQVSIRTRVDLWAILRLEGLRMYTIEILMKRCLTYEKCNFHFTINYFNQSSFYWRLHFSSFKLIYSWCINALLVFKVPLQRPSRLKITGKQVQCQIYICMYLCQTLPLGLMYLCTYINGTDYVSWKWISLSRVSVCYELFRC